jgi:hypothetical protein
MIFMKNYIPRVNGYFFPKWCSKLSENKPLDEKTIMAAAAALRKGCNKTMKKLAKDPDRWVYDHFAKHDPSLLELSELAERTKVQKPKMSCE